MSRKFHPVLFGLSALIFISTLSYWLISPDSPASIINILMKRASTVATNPQAHVEGDGGGIFFFHVLLTGIGLFVYYKSDFARWLGERISMQYHVKKFYYDNPKLSVIVTKGVKGVAGFAVILSVYYLIVEVIKGTGLPMGEFRFFLFSFFLLTTLWDVERIDANTSDDYDNILDFKGENMLFRLSPRQFSYVQENVRRDDWVLYKNNSYIDLSYKECYLFIPDIFNIGIENKPLSSDLIGAIKYTVRSEIRIENLPATLPADNVRNLHDIMTNPDEFDRQLVFNMHDKDELLTAASDKIYAAVLEYSNTDQSIFNNQSQKNTRDLINIIKNKADFRTTDKEIENKIATQVAKLVGVDNLFKITFKITDTEFKVDEMLKSVLDSQKLKQQAVMDANIRTQETLMQAGLKTITTPGMSKDKIKDIAELGKLFHPDLNLSSGSGNAYPTKDNLVSQLKDASKKIVNALEEARKDDDPTPEKILERVSGATPFFFENNIPTIDYLKRYYQKMNEEKAERINEATDEAREKLAEDTLTEFLTSK